jgi:hypothetical protein
MATLVQAQNGGDIDDRPGRISALHGVGEDMGEVHAKPAGDPPVMNAAHHWWLP